MYRLKATAMLLKPVFGKITALYNFGWCQKEVFVYNGVKKI